MKRQDTRTFRFCFLNRVAPHVKFDFEKGTFTLDENKTLFHCFVSEVLFRFPDPTPTDIIELKEFLDTYDHFEWCNEDRSVADFFMSCSSNHGSSGTSIRLETLNCHGELLDKLERAMERIARVSTLSASEFIWNDTYKVMRTGFRDEIEELRCPSCGGGRHVVERLQLAFAQA